MFEYLKLQKNIDNNVVDVFYELNDEMRSDIEKKINDDEKVSKRNLKFCKSTCVLK